MTPGDPLVFYEGFPVYRDALMHYQTAGFSDLGDEILEIVRNSRLGETGGRIRFGEVQRLWSLRLKNGHVLRGMLGMVESRNRQGRKEGFQFLYTSCNDGRYVIALTAGTFTGEEIEAFRHDHGGESDRGGQP
jgi:hypothetical protein